MFQWEPKRGVGGVEFIIFLKPNYLKIIEKKNGKIYEAITQILNNSVVGFEVLTAVTMKSMTS
jgi:hypothetical protein